MTSFAQALKSRLPEEQEEFTVKIIAKTKGSGSTYLIKAHDHTGYRAYYFLQVEPKRAPLFEKVMTKKGVANLKDYGLILVSGYGEVSAEHADFMRDRYGWQGHDDCI
jgi:hypothetical protein